MTAQIVVPDLALLEQAVQKFMGSTADKAFTDAPGVMAYVALSDADISGWCWGYRLPRPDGSSMLYVHQLEVDEAHRRQGIGRQLLQTFMAAGATSGATKMFLTTGADNTPARTLYDALGGGLATQGPTVNYWFLLAQP